MKSSSMAGLLFSFFVLVAAPGYAQTSPHGREGYLPLRVYDTGEKQYGDFEGMLQALARAEAVFVGEQHDDPATHRIERFVLEGLARRKASVVVAMEMFERDTQQALDDYLAGRITEEAFLKASRPWPRYATDYRPLVEFAKAHGWRVMASNTPRRIASQFSRKGMEALSAIPENERNLLATEIKCPTDEYYKKFAEVIGNGHPTENGKAQDKKQQEAEAKAMIDRFYYAQCVKDETMAESIVAAMGPNGSSQPKPVIVHFNGAFHSDFRLGTAARVIRRMPKSNVKVVTVIPVDDLDAVKPEEHRKKGDYVIFTIKPPAKPAAKPEAAK
ncbi:MAG: ChaN family lipoprotein [Blastocatellia bacterium]|nr:ChaN family lipoprotein [Blastocatellia bacterium]